MMSSVEMCSFFVFPADYIKSITLHANRPSYAVGKTKIASSFGSKLFE